MERGSRYSTSKVGYPATRLGPESDDYHGTIVADPFRWLEDSASPEATEWTRQQNDITTSVLSGCPGYDTVTARLRELWDYERYSSPHRVGNHRVLLKHTSLQEQPILCMMADGPDEPTIDIVDPNRLSATGLAALTDWAFSNDGAMLAYAISYGGSDWQEIRIRDINTATDYPETIRWAKSEDEVPFSNIAWHPHGSGFFYSRYPSPDTVDPRDRYRHCQVYWHQVNTPQDTDALIFERPDDPELNFVPIVTEDGRYLVLLVWNGLSYRHRIYYRTLDSTGEFIRLLDRADARYDFLGNSGEAFYFGTNAGAPRGRVVRIELGRPTPDQWQEIIPEQPNPILRTEMFNGRLIVVTVHDAHHHLSVFGMDGVHLDTIPLPDIGTVSDIVADPVTDGMYFRFESPLVPTTLFSYDFAAKELKTWYEHQVPFEFDAYATRQLFFPASDGTRLPMTLIHKTGLRLDGTNPLILHGYGGFNVSLTPSFDTSRLLWLENGGVFVIANLRGGSEYGDEWHEAGKLQNKQTVFDDYIAAAEWLIRENYTSSERLVIDGESNGGLLVSACMLQRPDLFAGVICSIPVTDMLRYHKHTIGWHWIPEYGNAESDPDQFATLYSYSPLHNVENDTPYPPILVTTADGDDRVVPGHAMKFVATLQASARGDSGPVLLRVQTDTGHGIGKSMSKQIQLDRDIHVFTMNVCGISTNDGYSE